PTPTWSSPRPAPTSTPSTASSRTRSTSAPSTPGPRCRAGVTDAATAPPAAAPAPQPPAVEPTARRRRGVPRRRGWTYDDYLAIPDDGNRYEIIFGELFMVAAPFPERQRAILNLCLLLAPHARAHGLGEVLLAPIDVLLAPR